MALMPVPQPGDDEMFYDDSTLFGEIETNDDTADDETGIARITMQGRVQTAAEWIRQRLEHMSPARGSDSFTLRALCWEASGTFAPTEVADMLRSYLELPDLLEEQYDYVTLDNSLRGMLQQRLCWWMRDELARLFAIDGPVEGQDQGGAHG